MPHFHFHLRAHGMIHRDAEGTQLPDLAAARAHASAVADELLLHSPGGTRHWSMLVTDEDGEALFDFYLADVDPSLASYAPEMRMLVAKTCRRLGALADVLSDLRATRTESRVLLARARGAPQLVYARGGK
jgi:hypothetical protein